jgi:ornithine cyclodeaminase/alanine dehydrogenase-like protein (mu-crystallin family)
MLLISSERLRELVPMGVAIDAVRDAFVQSSRGNIEQPTRLALRDGRALVMLAADSGDIGTVLKAVTVRPENRQRGLPSVQAVVVCFDGTSGRPTAVIDGTALTALRTGAASGVATDLLGRPDAAVLAVIGTGGQAADQVRGVCTVRAIRQVRVASRHVQHAREFAVRLGRELAPVPVVAASVRDAINGADVVCTTTTSTEPLFAASDLSPDVHVNAIGAYTEAMCELPPDLCADATVVAVDAIDAAMVEAGDLLRAMREGRLRRDQLIEIGDLLTRPWLRQHGRTVFKSVGVAAQDWALARLAVERSMAGGGRDLDV